MIRIFGELYALLILLYKLNEDDMESRKKLLEQIDDEPTYE